MAFFKKVIEKIIGGSAFDCGPACDNLSNNPRSPCANSFDSSAPDDSQPNFQFLKHRQQGLMKNCILQNLRTTMKMEKEKEKEINSEKDVPKEIEGNLKRKYNNTTITHSIK